MVSKTLELNDCSNISIEKLDNFLDLLSRDLKGLISMVNFLENRKDNCNETRYNYILGMVHYYIAQCYEDYYYISLKQKGKSHKDNGYLNHLNKAIDCKNPFAYEAKAKLYFYKKEGEKCREHFLHFIKYLKEWKKNGLINEKEYNSYLKETEKFIEKNTAGHKNTKINSFTKISLGVIN